MWQQAVRGASAEDRALLDRVETERAARYLRASDRDRFVTAAVTLRRAVAAVTGFAAAEVVVDRTCVGCGRPHGKTTLKTLGIEASLSHAGEVVAVALTTIGPVGVDVERVAEIDFARLDEQITAPGELASASRLEVFQRWTRKEAVLKAVGTGMDTAMAEVRLGLAEGGHTVLACPGVADVALRDLDVEDGYVGAVAVVGRAAPIVSIRRARPT